MKVQLKDLVANQFRMIDDYALLPDKIRALEESIKETGFWNNMCIRKYGDKYEIDCGHHRLQALRNLFPPEHKVDLPLEDCDDETWIKRMINENGEEWGATTAQVDENVYVAREFLYKRLDVAATYAKGSAKGKILAYKELYPHRHSSLGSKGSPVGRKVITNFLKSTNSNWNERKVVDSLHRLKLIKDGSVDKDAVEMIDKPFIATNFAKAAAKYGLTKEQQKEAAKKIKTSADIDHIVLGQKIGGNGKPKKKTIKADVQKLPDFIAKVTYSTDNLTEEIKALGQLKDALKEMPEAITIAKLLLSLNTLRFNINNFLNITGNEEDTVLHEGLQGIEG